ncbi:MAG: GNAT family N-acetyltransferase [Lachnospiraceae bacterium]|nr:GNAT family N-acetyltransferase [Lachnospiraceae bacterium]
MTFNYKTIEDINEYTGNEPYTLYLTSSKHVADFLRSNNEAICIVLESDEDVRDFGDYKYFVTEPYDVNHLKKIYCHINNIPHVIAANDSVIIREEIPEDLKKIYAMYEDEACKKFLTPLPPFYTFDPERRFASVKNGYMLFGYGIWIIEKTETHEVIGRVGFEYYDSNSVSLGFMIKESERKKGYAYAAAHIVVDYLRKTLPEMRIVAKCNRENPDSVRILESLDIDYTIIESV